MKCPDCGFLDSKVLNSRPNDDSTTIKRRRECLRCKARFTTIERIETGPIRVVKKDGTTEPFCREKIEQGIMSACYKRPVLADDITNILDKIENEILQKHAKEISSEEIGEIVIKYMKELDEVAYVRFASVYREFKDVNTFIDEIKKLQN